MKNKKKNGIIFKLIKAIKKGESCVSSSSSKLIPSKMLNDFVMKLETLLISTPNVLIYY